MDTVGIQFTETMKGFWTGGAATFEEGDQKGRTADCQLQVTLTVRGDDLNLMLSESTHSARMYGSAIAPALSSKPLTVSDGIFNLFVANPDDVETRNMRYRMTLVSEEGKSWLFEGFKVIHKNSVFDVWHDTSTLYIAIHADADPSSRVIGKGILHIEPIDFARQMTSLEVLNAKDAGQSMSAIADFGRFFAGTLFQTYGGIFARPTAFDPSAAPRRKRALRVGVPHVHPFRTRDGESLLLTRYRGGPKGPVVLCHGLGVSSLIFSLDTIETNLLEFLYQHEYDVWLLDFRNSIELPASRAQSCGDDVALYDYPAAVNKVREVTGARDVQMVVHCWGSTTFFMAMLAGLEGVRSAVCSQIAAHFVTPTATHVKAGLHLPSVLDALGVKTLSAFSSTQEDLPNKLFDFCLRLYPMELRERCESPTCHRISFMYAPLYRHRQLNEATHATLHETFGVANMRAFEHLALLANKGRLVDFAGRDVYLPQLQRLKLPLTFIHGSDNECFLPESTQITYDLLSQRNGKDLYTRHVVPNYGHIDCIMGKNAARDVYPLVVQALDRYGRASDSR